MKVLLCIDNLGSGGAQRQIVSLAVGLKNRGHNVAVFVYYPQNFFRAVLTNNNIEVFYVAKTNRLGFNVIVQLSKILIKGKYDIAISYLTTPNIYLALASRFSLAKTKIITSERTKTNITNSLLFKFKYWCHEQAAAVVFNSNHERFNWTNKFKLLQRKTITIYNGVNTDEFKPAERQYTRTKTIIGIGTIGPSKNILTLVKALKLLKDEGFNYEVHWYGKYIKTQHVYAEYYDLILKAIEENGLIQNWKWFKPEKEINKIIINYDFLISTSVIEGLPNVVCEALACGVPVLISNVLDHPQLVENDTRGYLFDPDDHRKLAENIKKIESIDQSKYDQMRSNCREYAVDKLSLKCFIGNYEELLNRVCEARA